VHSCHQRVKQAATVDALLRNKAASPDFKRNRLCILAMQTDTNDGSFMAPSVKSGLNVWETHKCRMPNRLPSESVGVKPSPFWESLAYLWPWRAELPHRPPGRLRIRSHRIRRRVTQSSSARRKSLTSACRPSTFSTRKTPRSPRQARRLLGGAAAGAAVAGVAAAAAGEAAAAVAAVAAAADAASRSDAAGPADGTFQLL
jgi:hypothetical protein